MTRYLWSKYFMTTPDPGARLVFTHGLTWKQVPSHISRKHRKALSITAHDYITRGLTSRPNSQAFLATRPAPSITLGFEVFVQLVIAAITTLPCLISAGCPWKSNLTTLSCCSFGTANRYLSLTVSFLKQIGFTGKMQCGPENLVRQWNQSYIHHQHLLLLGNEADMHNTSKASKDDLFNSINKDRWQTRTQPQNHDKYKMQFSNKYTSSSTNHK